MTWPSQLPLNNERARSLVICSILFPIISTLSVAGRFAARRIKTVSLGPDDWVTLPALVRHPLRIYEEIDETDCPQLAVYAQMVITILCMPFPRSSKCSESANIERETQLSITEVLVITFRI